MQYQEADTVSVTSSHAFRTSAQHEPRTTSRGKVRTVEHPHNTRCSYHQPEPSCLLSVQSEPALTFQRHRLLSLYTITG